MNGLRNQPNAMKTFTAWLNQALSAFVPADRCYQERLVAFNRLMQSAASSKESCPFLRELIQALTRQDFQKKLLLNNGESEVMDTAAAHTLTLTFTNGICSRAQVHCGELAQGIYLYRLADLSLEEQQVLAHAYRSDVASHEDLFALLNGFLCQETYVLKIEDHVQVENIIAIEHAVTATAAHSIPHLLIKVGKGAQATIIENGSTTDNMHHFGNSLTHITLEEGADLSYYTLGHFPCCWVNTLYCNQEADSLFTHYVFATTEAILRMHLIVQLNGNCAAAKLYGLYGLGEKEKGDYRVHVRHRYPNSLSKQHYKGILGGASTGVFNGTIYVAPEAQQTHAYQTNNVLMLAPTAHHYVQPQLEIYADDVKCSHGATVGQLDPTQLFYLQSRGISEICAKRLLIEAFGKEIIETIPLLALQDKIWAKFLTKLLQL